MDASVEAGLRLAGSAAVDVNAPLGEDRLAALVGWAAGHQPTTAVDLGCGHGSLLVQLVQASTMTHGIGVDIDPQAVEVAEQRAQVAGVQERTTWIVDDASSWDRSAEAVVAVGVEHVFGGVAGLLTSAADLATPGGIALIGAGVWSKRPDRWCRATFGVLPRMQELVDRAELGGWHVEDIDLSTLEEWDAFEAAWTDGVEAVGTPEAISFAAERRADYARYRGVLGMAWLQLGR